MKRRLLLAWFSFPLFLLLACSKGGGISTQTRPPQQNTSLGKDVAVNLEQERQATFQSAVQYYEGIGGEKDLGKAFHLFENAGQQGDVQSQFNAGMMSLRGEGTAQDSANARNWFLRAAQNGYVDAYFQLGLLAYNGTSEKQDFRKALDLFTAAALGGSADAQFNEGVMYLKGQGSPKDPVEAYAWFTVAKNHGSKGAKNGLNALSSSLTSSQRSKAKSIAADIERKILSPK